MHRLLVRRGEAAAASQVLRAFARATSDEEARAELLRKELELSEYLGELGPFERVLVSLPGRTTSARKLAVRSRFTTSGR